MPAKKRAASIDVEDASQLAMLAYQFFTRPAVVNWQRFVERMKSDRAKAIAHVIVGQQESVGDDTLRDAKYYQQWARETAKTAQEASRRPVTGRKRAS